jgi:hypothetical protein
VLLHCNMGLQMPTCKINRRVIFQRASDWVMIYRPAPISMFISYPKMRSMGCVLGACPSCIKRPFAAYAPLAVRRRKAVGRVRVRGLAQLVEHRSPKPRVVGSSPSAPATRRRDMCIASCDMRNNGMKTGYKGTSTLLCTFPHRQYGTSTNHSQPV